MTIDLPRATDRLCEFVGQVDAYPEVPGVVRWLQERFRVAVASDIDDDIIGAALACIGLAFEFVFTSEQSRSYKGMPGSPFFLAVLDALGVAQEHVLHVGDAEADVAGAHAAGIRVVRVNRTGRPLASDVPQPDAEIGSLSELAALLDGGPAT